MCLLCGSVLSVEMMTKNPIRKVVTLMQNMQKEAEAEGEKSKELHEKFLCYCKASAATLSKANADATAAAEDFGSAVKADSAAKAQLSQELAEHKKDRDAAKEDLEEATSLRSKEAAEFAATKADSETNIAALGSAIPAIEQGMSGASFMQMPGASHLRQLIDSYPNLEAMDRRDVMAFLDQSGGDYAPSSGQIVGILKQMKDEFEANLKSASDEEATAVASFEELSGEKAKEIDVATEQIETKMARSGELAVSIVQAKDGLEDNTAAGEDAAKSMAALKEQCAAKEKAYASETKDRADEIAALSQAISVLNDDDALDIFKKAVPELIQEPEAVSFLQRSSTRSSTKAQRALHVMQKLAAKTSSPKLGIMFAQLKSKLTAKHGAKKFEDIAKMIESMVTLLGKQQDEDDKQKEWCRVEFDKAGDEEASAKTKLASVEAELAELGDAVATFKEEIDGLTQEVTELDYTVAQATVQRKTEHQAYVEAIQMQSAAVALIAKAKKKLEKFYKPALVQSPVSFVQIRSSEWALEDSEDLNEEVQDTQAAEQNARSEAQHKAADRAKSVLLIMDQIIHQTEMATKDSESAEKTAQDDYAKMMIDSQETRAAAVKSISDKEVAKSTAEKNLVDAKETEYLTKEGLLGIASMTADLHSACDFLVENYDLRKEARGNEMDSLKNAKVILTGF